MLALLLSIEFCDQQLENKRRLLLTAGIYQYTCEIVFAGVSRKIYGRDKRGNLHVVRGSKCVIWRDLAAERDEKIGALILPFPGTFQRLQ